MSDNQPDLDISYYKQHRDNMERQFLEELKKTRALERQIATQQEQISKLLGEIDQLKKGGGDEPAVAPTKPKSPAPAPARAN